MSQMNPPVHSDFQLPVEPPAWPKVIGILSIVWASLNLLCNACSVVGQVFSGALVGLVPAEQQEQMKAQLAASQSPLMFVAYALGFITAILLVAAGIQTLRRQPLGRLLHLAYGGLGVLTALIGAGIGWTVVQAQMANASGSVQQQQAAQFGGVFGLAFGICFGLLYPVFCLVWFGVVKRNAAQMLGGATGEAETPI